MVQAIWDSGKESCRSNLSLRESLNSPLPRSLPLPLPGPYSSQDYPATARGCSQLLLIVNASGFSCSKPLSPCRAQVPSLTASAPQCCAALPALCEVPGAKLIPLETNPSAPFPEGFWKCIPVPSPRGPLQTAF